MNNEIVATDWSDVLEQLKEKYTINLNYGVPSDTYTPVATFVVKNLIDTTNYSREVSPESQDGDVLVELEKVYVDTAGNLVFDSSYKLYVPYALLTAEDIMPVSIKNKEAFSRKIGMDATTYNIARLTTYAQKLLVDNEEMAFSGIKLHRERSFELDRLEAKLVYVEEKVVDGNPTYEAKDVSAPNNSIAIYGEKIIKKNLIENKNTK